MPAKAFHFNKWWVFGLQVVLVQALELTGSVKRGAGFKGQKSKGLEFPLYGVKFYLRIGKQPGEQSWADTCLDI